MEFILKDKPFAIKSAELFATILKMQRRRNEEVTCLIKYFAV